MPGSAAGGFGSAPCAAGLHGSRRRAAGLRLRVEMRREAEERKERRGIEEEGDLFDLGGAELEDHQGPGVVAAARDARLVLPERHAAVRPYGWYQPRAAT